MKLKMIEKICKNAGGVYIMDHVVKMDPEEIEEDDSLPRQWMGDGASMYALDGLPYLDEEAVYAIFDVDAKKREKLHVRHYASLPEGVDFGDLHAGDSTLEPLNFKMSIGSDELYLLRDKEGALMVIKSVYNKPFDALKECEYFKRVDKSGHPYVAVIHGCILRGVIYPYMIDKTMVETLGEVYNAAGVASEQLHI